MSDKRQKTDSNNRLKLKDARTPTNYWLCLSDEMVLFILRHLPQKDLVTVSLVNKKFRDLSRDDSLWTRLTLDYQDIKQAADSCRKLVERCKKLETLEITNESRDQRSLNIMSVVYRAKKSLKRLDVHSSIQKWTDAALAKLGEMEELKGITMSLNAHYQNPNGKRQFPKLDHLEDLCIHIHKRFGSPMLKKVLQHLTKLKKVDIWIADEGTLADLIKNNPDLKELRLHCLLSSSPIAGILGPLSVFPVSGNHLQRLRSMYPEIDIKGFYED